jgi:hypothetical protein
MDVNWVEASLCFPTFPASPEQTFLGPRSATSPRVCTYNDWMVSGAVTPARPSR